MQQFTINKNYEIRFIGDSELRPLIKITKRTEKSIWTIIEGAEKMFKIHTHDNKELFFPLGRYSMAPICRV